MGTWMTLLIQILLELKARMIACKVRRNEFGKLLNKEDWRFINFVLTKLSKEKKQEVHLFAMFTEDEQNAKTGCWRISEAESEWTFTKELQVNKVVEWLKSHNYQVYSSTYSENRFFRLIVKVAM